MSISRCNLIVVNLLRAVTTFMHKRNSILPAVTIAGALLSLVASVGGAEQSPYARWTNGLSSDPKYFPIAVWVQQPSNAERYKEAGINLYVGLWRGPTSNHLAVLQRAGMRVICSQNSFALANKDNPWSFDELDSITVAIADAPRPNEILVVMAIGTGGRPNPRVGKGRAIT